MRSELRFLATGKPMNINTKPILNREPSRKGVQMSGIVSRREFASKIQQTNSPSNQSLGRKAVSIQKATGRSFNTTI